MSSILSSSPLITVSARSSCCFQGFSLLLTCKYLAIKIQQKLLVLLLEATLDIFLIFLTAEEEDAARSESMGGRKNRGLDAGRRFTVKVSVLPTEEARLERLLNEGFPSSSCRNESLLFRALP